MRYPFKKINFLSLNGMTATFVLRYDHDEIIGVGRRPGLGTGTDRTALQPLLIPYKGRQVVYQQMIRKDGRPFVIVPGFKASEPYTTRPGFFGRGRGSIMMDVEPINGAEKDDVLKLLADMTEGPINFW